MSGQVLRVIPRQVFDFTYLGVGANEGRALVGKIPSAQFTEGSLLLRVHNKNIVGTGAIVVNVAVDASTDEDPLNPFVDTQSALAEVSLEIATGPAPGTFTNVALTAGGLASMLAVTILANQGTAGDALVVDISADLILKSS